MCECVWGGIFSFFYFYFYTRSVRSKRTSGASGSQERALACGGALGSCVKHPARLSSDHPWGALSPTNGVTVEPLKATSHKRKKTKKKTDRIWTACLTSAAPNDSRVMPDDSGLRKEYKCTDVHCFVQQNFKS